MYSLEDYLEVQNYFIDFIRAGDFSDVAIYRFGNIGEPGISDLDLLIVGDQDALVKVKNFYDQLVETSDKVKFIMFHPPVLCPLSLVSDLNKFHTLYNLVPLNGASLIKIKEENIENLEYEWATSLLVLAVEILNADWSVRNKLLLQKNLSVSLKKLCNIDVSDEVRKARSLYLKNELTEDHINDSIHSFTLSLAENLTPPLIYSFMSILMYRFRVNSSVVICKNNSKKQTFISAQKIFVPERLFHFLCHHAFGDFSRRRKYISFNEKLKQEGLPKFTPTPFGLRFYKNRIMMFLYSFL